MMYDCATSTAIGIGGDPIGLHIVRSAASETDLTPRRSS
jgi:hypothetical protein